MSEKRIYEFNQNDRKIGRGRLRRKNTTDRRDLDTLEELLLRLICILNLQHETEAADLERYFIFVDKEKNEKEKASDIKMEQRINYLRVLLEDNKEETIRLLEKKCNQVFEDFVERYIMYMSTWDCVLDKESDTVQPVPAFLDPLPIDKQNCMGMYVCVTDMLQSMEMLYKKDDSERIKKILEGLE
jgi:hypothetical protein